MVNRFELAKQELVATPALVVDLPTVERNLQRLHSYADQHGLKVRPHTKTHKSRRFARMQVEHGSVGLTVAKLGEAEVMGQESSDILIAYPAIDPDRRRRVAELARTHTVRVAVDSQYGVSVLAAAAEAAGTTIGILVDLNIGFPRTGVPTPAAALELAQQVVQAGKHLRLDGILIYPGHVWAPADQQEEILTQIDQKLAETIELWQAHGLSVDIVSGGSTPTAFQSHFVRSLTEIRPGTNIFNDMNTVRAGFCELDDCAAAVIATVVSTAVPGKCVIDAGNKTLTSDRNVLQPDSGHGHVVEYPQARIIRLSEEHGEIDFSGCDQTPQLGERVTIIPNHICPCVNLQDQFYLQTPEGIEKLNVDARGLLA
ncbi:D-TA family PLP-dependent enzyme [Blastopirellula sp. JC732]|uniref:D-TA family PLP-dependent enzyme n=1 Tax=Blastopirellula sediminis TaxID=2894196 RepID=A0A9X1MRR1_9BACT|nr:D-TA family PLP-dependent enzyme [Blastopirellula sediminis]MCC9605540.1 D-TA family PLP-dependent enzyme [Blastopirellula sediminis]MCC9631160.1 D-TA family PLP-dependent enzyme [Blastopirellula sediminis]